MIPDLRVDRHKVKVGGRVQISTVLKQGLRHKRLKIDISFWGLLDRHLKFARAYIPRLSISVDQSVLAVIQMDSYLVIFSKDLHPGSSPSITLVSSCITFFDSLFEIALNKMKLYQNKELFMTIKFGDKAARAVNAWGRYEAHGVNWAVYPCL